MAFTFHADGVSVAVVKRVQQNKPLVELSAFFPEKMPVPAIVLEKLGKDLHANAYRCSTLVAAADYQFLSVEAPNVPPAEMKIAVGWRLKDMIDFPVSQATVDVLNIPGEQNGAARNQQVFAIVARNSAIGPLQELFTQSKLDLTVIDIPEMAQRNISMLLAPEGRGLAMLSFDADGGLLTVTFNGELYLSRRIDVTLAQLSDADSEKKQHCYDKVTLELQRSLDHFDRQYHFVTVAKLVLAPTGADGLHGYLSANLYMSVEVLNLDSVFDLSGVPALQDALQQARAFLTLGAALRFDEVAS